MAVLHDIAMTAVRAASGFIDRLHAAGDRNLSLPQAEFKTLLYVPLPLHDASGE
jgi:hypothetical protein